MSAFQPMRWRGRSYPRLSWLLADFYRHFPLASDAEVGRRLGVSANTVGAHRRRVGIPEFRKRDPANCYLWRSAGVGKPTEPPEVKR